MFKLEVTSRWLWRVGWGLMAQREALMLKQIDIPPLWLVFALGAIWAIAQATPVWPQQGLGLCLIALGLAAMAVAVAQMLVARTSFIPRRDPSALVTGGVFSLSRNPIYLGDALVLLGAACFWGAWAALPVVAGFMVWITRRYILDEEARLRAGFGPAFAAWSARVPRWIWRI